MLAEWDKQSPDRVANIFRSMQNVTKSHLLDTDLFDFKFMNQNSIHMGQEVADIFDANLYS